MIPPRPIRRRTFLVGSMSATLAAAASPAAAAPASDGRKLVIVILRGAMDGLAVLPKLDDPHIEAYRAGLIDRTAKPLVGGFALHSAMPGLHALYGAGEAGFIPAIAGPWRERSHFAAQDLLESGSALRVTDDGWLNRALQVAPGPLSAVSIGAIQPLILRGGSSATSSWSPPVLPEASTDTLQRLVDLYAGDALLAPALAAAMQADAVAADMTDMKGRTRAGPAQYSQLMSAAGRFLAAPDGPAIAVVSLDGWDTHAGQNQALTQRLAALDSSLASLRRELGPAWSRTALIAVSEFGRTVRENGARGTDHGTAGLAVLAGGAIRGGRIWGDWPGLAPAALYENRDLAPAIDTRSAFKGLLRDHLGFDTGRLDRDIFPGSTSAEPLSGLV